MKMHSLKKAAALAGLSINTIHADARNGRLPTYDDFNAFRESDKKAVDWLKHACVDHSDLVTRYGVSPETAPSVESARADDESKNTKAGLDLGFILGRACEAAPMAMLEQCLDLLEREIAERKTNK